MPSARNRHPGTGLSRYSWSFLAVVLPTPGTREHGKCQALSDAVLEHRHGQGERPGEREDRGKPNGAKISLPGATPRITSAATPMRPPTGMGTGSQIHRMNAPAGQHARRCVVEHLSGRWRQAAGFARRRSFHRQAGLIVRPWLASCPGSAVRCADRKNQWVRRSSARSTTPQPHELRLLDSLSPCIDGQFSQVKTVMVRTHQELAVQQAR